MRITGLFGLLLAMFVSMLSSTVVSTALPHIVADMGGGHAAYSWVVAASLLTMTATTPLWGKLADLTSASRLIRVALVVFLSGSVLAGTAPNMTMLISARLVQGIGMGGMTALVQVVIAGMVAPRERGRYFGYFGGVYAVATVSGPLLGGLLVDARWLGALLPGYLAGDSWRWCFFAVGPLALVALAMLPDLPPSRRRECSGRIDLGGAFCMAVGASAFLIWVSLAGTQFAWVSATTAALLGVGVVSLAAFVVIELRVSDPLVPLRLFRNRTAGLAVFASTMVGSAMLAASVFLVQYFQIARGMSPTRAGLMTLAMVGGVSAASLVCGRLISATGRWKRYLVAGGVLMVAGTLLLSGIGVRSSLAHIGFSMAVLGAGIGAMSQNLVLVVQNSAPHGQVGSVSSVVTFFRGLGGSIGVSALGAALGHRAGASVASRLERLGIEAPPGVTGDRIPAVDALSENVRAVFESAFAEATRHMFLLMLTPAALALICVLLLREVPLRETIDHDDERERTRPPSPHGGVPAGRNPSATGLAGSAAP